VLREETRIIAGRKDPRGRRLIPVRGELKALLVATLPEMEKWPTRLVKHFDGIAA